MGLLRQPIRLLDIENVEAFVQRTIDRSGIDYSPDEREELLAEGMTILYELATKYRPLEARPGIDEQGGRFSGYAAMFLPRRLGDAWHKNHPEHRYVTDPETGKRGWIYEAPMLSLNALTDSQAGDMPSDHTAERHLLNARKINEFCHATRAASLRVRQASFGVSAAATACAA